MSYCLNIVLYESERKHMTEDNVSKQKESNSNSTEFNCFGNNSNVKKSSVTVNL